jgi:hypothetical protein
MSEVGINALGNVVAEHETRKPEETLPTGRRRMPAADSGEGQVDDGLRGVAHELKLLGRRHAPPRLNLELLDRSGGVEREASRPIGAVAGRHLAIMGGGRAFNSRSICAQTPGKTAVTVGLNHRRISKMLSLHDSNVRPPGS